MPGDRAGYRWNVQPRSSGGRKAEPMNNSNPQPRKAEPMAGQIGFQGANPQQVRKAKQKAKPQQSGVFDEWLFPPGGSANTNYRPNPYTAAPEYMQLQRAQAQQQAPVQSRAHVPQLQPLNIQGFRPTGNTNPYLQMASLMNTSRGQ